jgi:hypothetical protein
MRALVFLAGISIGAAATVKADGCIDAVRVAIKAASEMNDSWHEACLFAASGSATKSHCDTTYAIYARVFRRHK